MIKYLRYSLMYPVLLSSVLGLARGGAWMWLGLAVCLVLMVGGDELLAEDGTAPDYGFPGLLNFGLLFTLPFILAMYLLLIWMCAPDGDPFGLAVRLRASTGWDLLQARERTGAAGLVGGVLTTMLMTGIAGVNVAHELMHRGNFAMKALARLLEVFSFDAPSDISHLRGHHVLVGMRDDPSTSHRGETAYAFLARAIVQANWFSWKFEARRMQRLGKSRFSWRNRFLQGHAMSSSVTVCAFLMSGWRGALAFCVTSILAKSLLELINYIQHYGLVRAEGTPIAARHSWNSNKCISSYMLCNATRHSCHHVDPGLPFWRIAPAPDAPTLRFGYLSSVLIALVPPLWHRVMVPQLLAWDTRHASAEERKLAAEQNRRSGLPRLVAAN